MAAADEDDFVIPVKKRKGKKNDGANKGIPRKALKNLIAHELEVQAKETFETLMKDKSLGVRVTSCTSRRLTASVIQRPVHVTTRRFCPSRRTARR